MRGIVIVCLVVAAGTTGCAYAPAERTEAERLFRFESGRTPYSAAICIARNARNHFPSLAAEERLLGAAGWEVVVAAPGRAPHAVAQVQANRIGSLITLRAAATAPGGQTNFAHRLVADCQAEMIAR